MRQRLRSAARKIAAARGEQPSGPFKALRKLFIQERRDYGSPGSPRIGWKRGELAEVVLAALLRRGSVAEEWGDVGYYVAQTWALLWWVYSLITPPPVIERAVEKYERRAQGRR